MYQQEPKSVGPCQDFNRNKFGSCEFSPPRFMVGMSLIEASLLFLGVQQLDVHVLRAVRAGHLPRHPRDEAVLLRSLVHPDEIEVE